MSKLLFLHEGGVRILKIKSKVVIIIILSSLLVACNNGNEYQIKASFIGQIETITNNSATVFVSEYEGTKIGGLVVIDLSQNPDEIFQVGDKVKVGYDGTIMETAPLSIQTLKVEKIAP